MLPLARAVASSSVLFSVAGSSTLVLEAATSVLPSARRLAC
jgi:hypothetical protein